MNENLTITQKLRAQTVVQVSSEVDSVQGANGELISRERLGPGIVHELGPDRTVRVYWAGIEQEVWVDADDLVPSDPRARLVVIHRYGRHGRKTLDRCKVSVGSGLLYNWTVQLLPRNVVRTVRADGSAWTFNWYPFWKQAHPVYTLMEDALAEDDYAEALTVAELAAI